MRVQQFRSHVSADATGRAVITIPFDPDETWGAKAFHPVGGRIQTVAGVSCGRRLRGRLTSNGSKWVFTVNPMWMRDTGVAVGDEVIVELEPEGPQRTDLAPDIASALEANPEAAAFFDTLAQFYRKAYLRWIDATTRRPDVRAARIAEAVELLAAGIKERPRR
jgi:Bacteriocin-protection, YdeI or OmpD-Associated